MTVRRVRITIEEENVESIAGQISFSTNLKTTDLSNGWDTTLSQANTKLWEVRHRLERELNQKSGILYKIVSMELMDYVLGEPID